MDANKLKVLREIGYEIKSTCGICEHIRIAPQAEFGTCNLQTYQHEKHTGDPRQLSVHRSGCCPRFQKGSARFRNLHGFAEFHKDAVKTEP